MSPAHGPRRLATGAATVRRFAWPLALALLLPACQEPGAATPPSETTAKPAAAMVRGEQVITGNAMYLERLALPPGAILQVRLIEQQRADVDTDGQPVVLSTARLVNVHGPSIPFALPYDPAEIHDDHQYGLQAILTSPDGDLLFATDATIAVDPGHPEPVEFRMLHVNGVDARAVISHWQCGPLSVDAAYNQSDNSVSLAFSGRELKLPLARSGSGARYADEQGNEFWTKGDSGSLTLTGAPGGNAAGQPRKHDCVRTDRPSPWTRAAARGVAFRAQGGEPGWFVEVGRGASPTLRATLDYARRTLIVPDVQPLEGAQPGFTGDTADGIPLVLEIRREPCRSMSGEVFEARARLTVDKQSYAGCGAFLPASSNHDRRLQRLSWAADQPTH